MTMAIEHKQWVHITGRHRCQRCGKECRAAWYWFESVGTWTRCYCESCVDALIQEEETG